MKKIIYVLCMSAIMLACSVVGTQAATDYTLNGTTFTVYTADGLMEVAKIINGESGDTSVSYITYDISIANDIDMSGKTWKPIGKNDTYVYTGTVYGNGNTISNLKRENYPSSCLGFIGVGGLGVTVKDLDLVNVTLTSSRDGTAYAGGIIGKAKGAGEMTVSGCSVQGVVGTNQSGAGGIAGAVTSIYSKFNVSGCTVDVIATADVSGAGAYVGYKAEQATVTATSCTIRSDYVRGGTEITAYTADGLMTAASYVNSDTAYSACTINIGCDINMSGKTWIPIGKDSTYAFSGRINGNGYTVSNLTSTSYSTEFLAFVGVAGSGAEVKDLHLTNVDFRSSARGVAGIIASVTSDASITGCTVKGSLYSGNNYAGGLVAVVSTAESSLTISNCAVDADVTAIGHSAAGIVAGDVAGGYTTNDLSTFPVVKAEKVYMTGTYTAKNRVGAFMGYNLCVNADFRSCISLATLNYTTATENGAFIAVDNKSKIYLENCIVMSDLHAFYNLSMSASNQSVEFKNCYLMKDRIGKDATIATYNQNGYYKYDSSATYKYNVIADVIVDGVGPTFTPFTVSNTTYRVPIIQYNLPSGTENEVMTRAYDAAMAMFANGSVQESFVHKHTWGAVVVKTESTYTSEGVTTHACAKCHTVKSVSSPCKESAIDWDYDEGTKTLTISGEGSMGTFATPNTIPWKSVRSKATSVVISNGIVDICDYAFYDFTHLRHITIPNGVQSIGVASFHNCRILKTLELPSSVKTIKNIAFEYCTSLESINIPSSVTSIGYGIFRFADDATPVITSNNSRYTVSGGCLVEVSTATVISGFKNSVIPTNAAIIGRSAFQGCAASSITVPSNITTVTQYAFADCKHLTSVNMASNAAATGEGAFIRCIRLTEISLPSSITTIDALAFSECVSLKKITLPASLTKIDISAFKSCTSLTQAVYAGTSSQWSAVSVSGGNTILTSKLVTSANYSTAMYDTNGELSSEAVLQSMPGVEITSDTRSLADGHPAPSDVFTKKRNHKSDI